MGRSVTTRTRRVTGLLIAAALAAGVTPAVAGAQSTTERTIVATGFGQANVTPRDRDDNASIVAAVERAEAVALPRAVTEAREYAADVARAVGVQLGPLVSVANLPTGPFYGPFPGGGQFGPNQYCGTVRQSVFRRDSQGRRRRVGSRARRICRVPQRAIAQVTLTFALA